MTPELLAEIFAAHVRDELARSEATLPPARVDTWADVAMEGQWVVVEDDEGLRSQVRLDTRVTRGVAVRPGQVAAAARSLCAAVLTELRSHLDGAGLVVSRPLPDPDRAGVACEHLTCGGIWLRLTVGSDDRGSVGVLSYLIGRQALPLAPPEDHVVWLDTTPRSAVASSR